MSKFTTKPFFKKKIDTKVDKVTNKSLVDNSLISKISNLPTNEELNLLLQKGDEFVVEVEAYSDLPTSGNYPNTETAVTTGDIALVKTASGTFLINRKPAGIYKFDGTKWNISADYDSLISELIKKPDKDFEYFSKNGLNLSRTMVENGNVLTFTFSNKYTKTITENGDGSITIVLENINNSNTIPDSILKTKTVGADSSITYS